MMHKIRKVLVFLLISGSGFSQNLVPNGDFENYVSCPSGFSQIPKAAPWFVPTNFSSTDLYHQCATNPVVGVPVNTSGNGYQHPYNGSGYAGIYVWAGLMPCPNCREYLEVPLVTPLIANQCYHFGMQINLSNPSNYTTDAIGVYFSNSAITNIPYSTTLPFTPQIINAAGNYPDTLDWLPVNAYYTATGGETHLTIGNFKNDAQTTVLQVASQPGNYAYFLIDQVTLTPCTGMADEHGVSQIRVYPNPATEFLNVTIRSNAPAELVLTDITSRHVLKTTVVNTASIPVHGLSGGVYLYKIWMDNTVIKQGKVFINYSPEP